MTRLAMLALLLGPGAGMAHEPEPEVIYRRHTIVSFGDDTVDGRLDQADLGYVESRKDCRHESLIRPRQSFRTAILSGARRL